MLKKCVILVFFGLFSCAVEDDQVVPPSRVIDGQVDLKSPNDKISLPGQVTGRGMPQKAYLKCESKGTDGDFYQTNCTCIDGSRDKPCLFPESLELTWSSPKVLYGELTNLNCEISDHSKLYTCEFKVKDYDIVELEFSLNLRLGTEILELRKVLKLP